MCLQEFDIWRFIVSNSVVKTVVYRSIPNDTISFIDSWLFIVSQIENKLRFEILIEIGGNRCICKSIEDQF